MATARFAQNAEGPESVIEFAEEAMSCCGEYVFLDCLQYVAAGGRLSENSAFSGDLLRTRPIVSPLANGLERVGSVRTRNQQVAYALNRMDQETDAQKPAHVMLEFSDNRDWPKGSLEATIGHRFPLAEILVRPFSKTPGAHMGPGTWAVTFLQTPAAIGSSAGGTR